MIIVSRIRLCQTSPTVQLLPTPVAVLLAFCSGFERGAVGNLRAAGLLFADSW